MLILALLYLLLDRGQSPQYLHLSGPVDTSYCGKYWSVPLPRSPTNLLEEVLASPAGLARLQGLADELHLTGDRHNIAIVSCFPCDVISRPTGRSRVTRPCFSLCVGRLRDGMPEPRSLITSAPSFNHTASLNAPPSTYKSPFNESSKSGSHTNKWPRLKEIPALKARVPFSHHFVSHWLTAP